MDQISALSDAERALFEALNQSGVRFLIVGLSAAVLQGANTGTRDIDIWFSFGMRPRQIGGDALGDRLDVVVHMDGLDAFATEYARGVEMILDGASLRLLPLERIIASKRASNRMMVVSATVK